MKRLTFWQNTVSIHQAPFIRALAMMWPGEVSVVTDEGLSEERRAAGWTMPDYGGARLHVGPHAFTCGEIVHRFGGAGSVHVFSSVSAYPGVKAALATISRDPRALVGVFAEAGSTMGGVKAWLRPWRHRLDALRWRDRIDFFLAAGSKGWDYYMKSWYRPERLYEFGYAVDSEPRKADSKKAFRRLLFVGQLIHRKGLDILLESMSTLPNTNFPSGDPWQLDVVGDGPLRQFCMRMARQLDLADRVTWHGNLPNEHVRRIMAEVSMLILPSRHDGWGAVVNEALMVGTPVVVSNGCGAADLIRGNSRGAVFSCGSVASLQAAIRQVAENAMQDVIDREQIREWAGRSISPEAFARYFEQVVGHAEHQCPKPSVPWQ